MRLKHIHEDLDDRDEFDKECLLCRIHGRNIDDAEGFHDAHTAASERGFYEAEMFKRGWVRFRGTWYKENDPRIKGPSMDKTSAPQ